MKTPKTKQPVRRIRIFIMLFCMLVFGCMHPDTAHNVHAASAGKATITQCKLTGKNKITVKAVIPNTSSIKGKKCYLFALPMSRTSLNKTDRPLKSRSKKKKLTFKVKLNQGPDGTLLSYKFVLAEKYKGKYRLISDQKYISNPSRNAAYTYAFPSASSKKGLQVASSMQEDALELGVSHATLNINLAHLIPTSAEQNKNSSYAFKYRGTTYWVRKSMISQYDAYLESLADNDTVVSAILLLGWRSDLKSLIYPSGRKAGHSYYAWNTKSASARKQLSAVITYLAKRYAGGSHGRIVNWIVGNEVNNYKVYNYAGKLSLKKYASVYAQAFRLVYQNVTSVYSRARVYISLDHLWNYKVSGAFRSRQMLDAFAKAVSRYGSVSWNLAYHPYGSPLTEPAFWENANKQVQNSIDSPVINMLNLSILTDYIKKNYGSDTRIILSEQGYTSAKKGNDTQTLQAAAIAYSYLITESNDMVDSFIMNRHVDHKVEIDQGLNLGLWTTSSSSASPEWAASQKKSYDVFKYMDTDQSPEVTSFALKAIGIAGWSQVIKNYSPALYSKRSAVTGNVSTVTGYNAVKNLTSGWKRYGAASSSRNVTGGISVTHSSSRNRNAQWGVQRSGKISFSNSSRFFARVTVSGASNNAITLKFRFYSGKNTFEASKVLAAGQTHSICVDLSEWGYKNNVTKILVTAQPKGSGTWKSGAACKLTHAAAG